MYSQFWMTVAQTDHIVVKIKACSDAHILLTSLMHGVLSPAMGSYEIVIGQRNNVTLLRTKLLDPSTNKVEVATEYILDCEDSRYFWVSWTDGTVQVGRGTTVGTNRYTLK